MLVLAVETSCDETAVAILRGDELLSSEVASQIAVHAAYGGVVPEVASRNHIRALRPVLAAALKHAEVRLDDVDVFAATRGPGLSTSLMVGLSAAKGLAVGFKKSFLGVNHIEGHLLSPFFGRGGVRPSVGLVVSGGHTLLIRIDELGQYSLLGQTHDDAAGEAFDKVGKLLGLPYPGGPNVNRLAKEGDPRRIEFPRSLLHSGDFHFSFSGLKTSVRYMLPKLGNERLEDVCASFQEAVVDVLVAKTVRAAETIGVPTVAMSGGVTCNTRLREKMAAACGEKGLELLVAEPALCTDNAGMIAYVAALRASSGERSALTCDINPNLKLITEEPGAVATAAVRA